MCEQGEVSGAGAFRSLSIGSAFGEIVVGETGERLLERAGVIASEALAEVLLEGGL